VNRRQFLTRTGGFAGGVAALGFDRVDALAKAQAVPDAIRRRIGITSVCFRERFKQTATGAARVDLDALTFPKFVVDNLGLQNVELWNEHFLNDSLAHAEAIRAAAEKSGARIINIQLDGSYDLSSANAERRATSIALVKRWMDRAKAVGAPTMRANTGPDKPGTPMDLKVLSDSFRQLADYGQSIGVKILIENHIGYSAQIDNVVSIVRAVNHPYCRALADWGNSDAKTDADRAKDMTKLSPYLELVSAKNLEFDASNRHISYNVVPIIQATEAAGYKGIYSIEFYSFVTPPSDVLAAAKTMVSTLAANIKA
jgi:sugar phosphate isomerase/epimerase